MLTAEQKLNALLPQKRLEERPSDDLLATTLTWAEKAWTEAERLGPMPLSADQLQEGYRLAHCPVFICGVHRSGTTLLRDMLDAHPELVVLPSEGTYYTNLEFKLKALPPNEQPKYMGTEWLRRLANPINQPPYWLLGRSSAASSPYIDFARYVMAWWAADKGEHIQWPHIAIILAYATCTNNLEARYWVDKTPANERYLKRIWLEMPCAKVIQLIREPRAVLLSRKVMEPLANRRDILKDLKMSYNAAVKWSALNDSRFLLLRYEHVCSDTEETVDSITSFLHISPSPTLSRPTVAGMPARANSSFNKQPAAGQLLNAGQHEPANVLSQTDEQLLAACVGEIAGRLNYPLIKVPPLYKLWLRLKCRLF